MIIIAACGSREWNNPYDPNGDLKEGFYRIAYIGLLDPGGMDYDGRYLWASDRYTRAIHRLQPSDGQILQTIYPNIGALEGICWDGRDLWASESLNRRLIELDPANGQTLSIITSPASIPIGLAYFSGNLYCCDNVDSRLYRIDPTSTTVLEMFELPVQGAFDITLDNNGLLLFTSDTGANIHAYDTVQGDCWLYATMESAYPRGVAYAEGILYIIARDGWLWGYGEGNKP